MSVFGSILSKIFHHAGATPPDQQTASAAPAPAPSSGPTPTPSDPASAASASAPAPASAGVEPSNATPPGATTTAAPANGASQTVDVAAVLEGLAAKNSQKLDWRHSIVDMMKLLDLDSGFASRQELAKELHYTGDMSDSAKMNMWLHGEVMKQLAANGGKVPDDLRV